MKLCIEPGWTGIFTREQAEGAIANGRRVVKVKGEAGDAHPVGATATVLGSLSYPELGGIGYFVEWDSRPRVAVFVIAWKIEAL
jgi:hypothetical protein